MDKEPIPFIEDSDSEEEEYFDLANFADGEDNEEWTKLINSLDESVDLNLLFDPSWKK